jgi:tyrosinase
MFTALGEALVWIQLISICRSLYIQALAAFQQVPETDPLSYFQIAGIHGRPYIPWDGVPWNPAAPNIGYCTHDDVLFPTWHRPYLALFEVNSKILVL